MRVLDQTKVQSELTLLAKKTLARMYYQDYLLYVHRGLYQHFRHTLYLCKELQAIADGEQKRLIVTMPPRHSKSMSITETFPSFFLGKNPNKRVITTAYGDSLARKFGRLNKNKIDEYGEELFGLTLNDDNASNNNWGLKGFRGGQISTGIGGSITGEGADLLIVDDPYKNHEMAFSEVQREKVFNEWQNTLLTRLHKGASVIVVQTRWHEDDLVGRLLKSEPEKWELINFPAIAEDHDILKREIGDPLCPELGFDEEWAENKRFEVGSKVWASLYQQRPSPESGDFFKRDWIQFYKVLPELDEMMISVDASFKDKKGSDFCVIQVWGKKGANKYLIDQVRDRMAFPATVAAIRSVAAKYPKAHAKLIEDKANGTAVIDYLKNEITGMIPVEPQGGKEVRASAISPQWEAGNVYLPHPSNAFWINDFVEELVQFPNAKHDDMVDAMTQALARWQTALNFFIGRA